MYQGYPKLFFPGLYQWNDVAMWGLHNHYTFYADKDMHVCLSVSSLSIAAVRIWEQIYIYFAFENSMHPVWMPPWRQINLIFLWTQY